MSTQNVRKFAGFVDLAELGTTGLNRFGGYVNEEFLKELLGKKAVKVYREMSTNDSTIGALLFAIKMLIRQVEWPVLPFSDAPEDLEKSEFLESCRDDMEHTWTDTLTEILTFLAYGWSYHEIVYKMRLGEESVDPAHRSRFSDGLIGWRKLPIRSQESLWEWVFAENGDILGMRQSAPPDYAVRTVPMEKALLFRSDTTKNNPEGMSILRTAYRSWFIKKHIENIEAIGIERDLAGLPIAWVPPDLLEADAPNDRKAILQSVRQIITNIKRDEQEGIVFPLYYDENGNKAYDLTLLSTGGSRQFDTSAVVNRYKQDILSTVMADFILLGHTQVGTFSLSSSKTELFATAIGAWMDAICDVFNRTAIPRLFRLNGWPTDRMPTLSHGDIESKDLVELGQFINALSTSGAVLFPNPQLENFLLRQAGLPSMQDEGAREDMPGGVAAGDVGAADPLAVDPLAAAL